MSLLRASLHWGAWVEAPGTRRSAAALRRLSSAVTPNEPHRLMGLALAHLWRFILVIGVAAAVFGANPAAKQAPPGPAMVRSARVEGADRAARAAPLSGDVGLAADARLD